jgi:hypothetical protein
MAWLAASTWIVLRVLLRLDLRETTVTTVGALGAMLALRIAWRAPHAHVEVSCAGLRIVGPDGERTVPWAVIERVRLTAGEVNTERGVVRVSYAQVDVTHGRPVAFADLAPLGSPHLRTVEGDAPILDVGDPELLLGAIAERIDAREFLPPEGQRHEVEPADPWFRATPLAVLRLAVGVLVVQRTLGLVTDGDRLAVSCAGIMAVLGSGMLTHAVLQRFHASPEESAPAVLVATSLTALTLAALASRELGAWSLTTALVLALPAWPMPGGLLARRAGRLLARTPDVVGAVLVAVLGVAAAWGYGLGHVLLPTALVAGGLEAAEGLAASRRHERLVSLPRFRHWPPVDLARLRASLRPADRDEIGVDLSATDVVELRDASMVPPPASLAPMFVSLVAVALLGCAVVATSSWSAGQRAAFSLLGP